MTASFDSAKPHLVIQRGRVAVFNDAVDQGTHHQALTTVLGMKRDLSELERMRATARGRELGDTLGGSLPADLLTLLEAMRRRAWRELDDADGSLGTVLVYLAAELLEHGEPGPRCGSRASARELS